VETGQSAFGRAQLDAAHSAHGRGWPKGDWRVSGDEREKPEKLSRVQLAAGGASRPQSNPSRRILAVNNAPGKGIAMQPWPWQTAGSS
jgi:hypothetical protein